MSRYTKVLWLLPVAALLVLSACGTAATPTQAPAALYTQLAATVLANLTQTAEAASPTPAVTDTPLPSNTPLLSPTPLSGTPFITPESFATPSNTPLLSSTPGPGVPTATPITLATLRPPSQAACDNAAFVKDVTYPDGSPVSPGQVFIKTWEFTNLGPCTWTTDYVLIFGWATAGTDWSGMAPQNFPSEIKPGGTLDISITLQAPSKTGGYAAWYRLQNSKGYNFGAPFAVSVLVK
jgi:hypothetical protein